MVGSYRWVFNMWREFPSRDVHAPIARLQRAKIRSIPRAWDKTRMAATALGTDLNQSHLQATRH